MHGLALYHRLPGGLVIPRLQAAAEAEAFNAGEEETDCNLGQLVSKGEVAWLDEENGVTSVGAAAAAAAGSLNGLSFAILCRCRLALSIGIVCLGRQHHGWVAPSSALDACHQ